ncbi:hypothetical protein FRC02_004067, partial [Tulasnella sp. 418]
MPRFECGNCGRVFKALESLSQHHQATRHTRHGCLCGRKFVNREALDDHRHHSSQHFGKICEDCDEDYSEENLLDAHIRGRRGIAQTRNCLCGRKFKTISDASQHARDSTIHIFCEPCRTLFESEEDRKCHNIIFHKPPPEPETPPGESSDPTPDVPKASEAPEAPEALQALPSPTPAASSQNAGDEPAATVQQDARIPICSLCNTYPEHKMVTECGHLFCRE